MVKQWQQLLGSERLIRLFEQVKAIDRLAGPPVLEARANKRDVLARYQRLAAAAETAGCQRVVQLGEIVAVNQARGGDPCDRDGDYGCHQLGRAPTEAAH